jgi:lipopolysaccharide/colanic/teichoic acid biosynthesis glycosyltransferase
MFRSMLVMERKRTERSNRPFMLIRIDISQLPIGGDSVEATNRIIRRIGVITRETDVRGWFSGGRVIGIIITDFCEMSADLIFEKVKQAVEAMLSPSQAGLVSMTKDIFPFNEFGGDENTIVLNTVLYNNSSVNTVPAMALLTCKRCIDIVGSLFFILLFSPVFLIVPLLIKFSSKGAVFFTQKRVGRYGKTFTCLKFRTMKQSNDDSAHKEFVKKFINNNIDSQCGDKPAEFKIKDDPRVTKIGKLLRKTSIDEIPQFFNVLFGDMSIVGPRPAIPYEVEEYDTWHRRRSLEVKPGITGIWQVKGRSTTDFNNMVRMDIRYINSWSPILDLGLIFKTPMAMVTAKGAY